MPDTRPALEARSLFLEWDGEPIVEDVSLSVAQGEIVCLVGRSGTGKSTLFHALAGLSVPASGRVLLDGRDVTGEAGRIGYMLQKDLLLPSMSVLDNACLPLVLRGRDRASARAEARGLLRVFGLEGTEGMWPSQLSGGMRQRAAFLRTYLLSRALGSSVVLLDEPFSALDAITRTEIRSWFTGMVHELGLSALVVTHDVDEAIVLGRRVIVLAGDPQAGVPSRIVGEVEALGIADSPAFPDPELSEAYLQKKRELLALLS